MHSSTGSSLSMGSEAKAEGMTGCCKMVSAGPKDRGRTQEGKCELDAGTGHDTRTTEGSPAALKELHVTHLWQGCCCLNPLGVVMLISMRWWGYSSILGCVWWINLPVRHRKKSRRATVDGPRLSLLRQLSLNRAGTTQTTQSRAGRARRVEGMKQVLTRRQGRRC